MGESRFGGDEATYEKRGVKTEPRPTWIRSSAGSWRDNVESHGAINGPTGLGRSTCWGYREIQLALAGDEVSHRL